ncbi:MAG: lipopolysaccharide biosynthesis protein [Desulfobaccales bacterium]
MTSNKPTSDSVLQKAVGSFKWLGLMQLVSRSAQPLIFLILARLLTPNDFGVMATAMVVVSFSQHFWDAGLGRALIQTQEAPEQAANVIFWANVALSLPLYAGLFLAAPWVAAFFHSPASLPVLRVLGLLIVINSFVAAQQNLFVRELDFRWLFWVNLATAVLPAGLSIPLAYAGYGVWALVAGSLCASLLNLLLLWLKSPWRPRLAFDRPLARRLFGFGLWVMLENLLGWFFVWGDKLVVGRVLGPEALGLYTVGWNLCAVTIGLILNPFLPALYPTFSRLQDDLEVLKATFHKVNRVIISLALPMGAGLFLVGPQIATVLFGQKWEGLGPVLSLLGLAQGISWLVGINTEVYRALGRPDLNTKLLFISILFYLPVYLLTAPMGLLVFIGCQIILHLLGIPLHGYLSARLLDVSPYYLWQDGRRLIISTLTMSLAVAGTKYLFLLTSTGLGQTFTLIILMGLGVITYGLSLWLLDCSHILQTARLVKRAAFN